MHRTAIGRSIQNKLQLAISLQASQGCIDVTRLSVGAHAAGATNDGELVRAKAVCIETLFHGGATEITLVLVVRVFVGCSVFSTVELLAIWAVDASATFRNALRNVFDLLQFFQTAPFQGYGGSVREVTLDAQKRWIGGWIAFSSSFEQRENRLDRFLFAVRCIYCLHHRHGNVHVIDKESISIQVDASFWRNVGQRLINQRSKTHKYNFELIPRQPIRVCQGMSRGEFLRERESDRPRRSAISSCASNFLKVVFWAGGQTKVDDAFNVRFVDSEAKGDGGDAYPCLSAHELALCPTPAIGVHSAMVTYNSTANASTVQLLGHDLGILLSPYINYNAPFAQAAFFNGQLFGSFWITFLLFLQNFV
mmetsp:Transcript_34366/g.72336  ORF Transcript_34366/g.72336 Transcript_34366/m.72336 type:complete len:365 (-) Transcript_34366:1810-2904(-)